MGRAGVRECGLIPKDGLGLWTFLRSPEDFPETPDRSPVFLSLLDLNNLEECS